MAKQIIRHLRKRRHTYLFSSLIVALAFGFYASFFWGGGAKALSGITLADTDTTGYGLDGRDFTITWTPGEMPSGYLFTKIYITSSTVTGYTTTTIEALAPSSYFNQYATANATLMQFMAQDSNGIAWATSSQYIAWVFVSTTNPADGLLVSSTAVSVTLDNVSDTATPNIEHMSVHTAKESTRAIIHAFVVDDQTTAAQFADAGDGGAEYFILYYATSTWVESASSTATSVGGDLYSFQVPTSSVLAAGGTFKYYLKAVDRNQNTKFFCADPSGNSNTSTCQLNPFTVNTVAAGARSIAGTIRNSADSSVLSGAYVFAGGYAELGVSTDGSGDYTIANLPGNNSFDVTANKVGFCKNMRFETIGTLDKTGVDMSLPQGSCGFYTGSGGGGGGAGMGAPQVVFTGPPDQMMGVQTGEQIRLGFNQPMDPTTINDTNAADAGSKVYLTTDDGTTKTAGAVTYCSNNSSPGCSALFSMDTNTILFSPSGTLATGTFYTLVITEGVKGTSGQAVQGNRAGGGHKINFTTMGADYSGGGYTLGSGGQFMPPYVKSMIPGPGMSSAPNTKILLEFSEALDSASLTNNVTLDGSTSGITVSLDSTEKRFITITPSSVLSEGSHTVRVLGGVKNSSGIAMRGAMEMVAFTSSFTVSGGNDLAAPTIYPMTASGTTGVAVNSVFQFGLSEQLSFSTINTTNITMSRGGTAAAMNVKYDAGKNNVYVIPTSALAPNTIYSITFGSSVTDLAGIPMVTSTYTYTTGAADSSKPSIIDSRCDDYTCKIRFNESMNHDSQVDSNWVSSTLNHFRLTLTQGGEDKIVTSTGITYDPIDKSITATGVGLTYGGANYSLVIAGVTDLSGNIITSTTKTGSIENSSMTFGSFGDSGMFAPPTTNFGAIGDSEFKPQGFGSFTADQFAFGQADMAFPFNNTASQDSNVFQIKFAPGTALLDGDQVVLTFPEGTNVDNAAMDTLSPYYSDFNQFANGTVSSSAITDDQSTLKVTITLDVVGTLSANDNLTIDLRKIVNPSVPKLPNNSEGYKIGIQVFRSGAAIVNKTTMPYFIMSGGSRRINVAVIAGTATTSPTNGANGTVYVFGGGPAGPLNKTLTLANGVISAVDGTSATVVELTNLNDGCYFFGTDPVVTLGSNDYYGQASPEPVCVNSTTASTTKYILLTRSNASGSVTTTVKLAGITFASNDIDIFAGGPGRFVVKTLTGVTTPDSDGYTINLSSNGNWFIGVGPAMPKGASGAKPTSLPGTPPSPIEVVVSNAGTVTAGVSRNSAMPLPPGVAFNDSNDTITFTFATADKIVSGTIRDGSGNALSSVEVFMHKQGFGSPTFGTSNASGTFSLSVSKYGTYEIAAFKDGLPPAMRSIDVRTDGSDAGTDPDIYFDGKQITGANPLILTLKKPSYSISGKVMDSNNNGISYAPVFARDVNGNSVFGMTGSDGSYTIFVDAGTWIVKSELPPDKSDTCGSFSKTVIVSTASMSNQNITPSTGTCFTLTGTVSVGNTNLTNVPLFIEEWDASNNGQVAGGIRRGTGTDSNGNYSVKLSAGTYRVGTWHPDYGELNEVKTVSADTTQNISLATTSTVSFVFTGGAANMNAFVELQKSSDSSKRISKQISGLATSTQVIVQASVGYKYFVDVFGYGKFEGTVAAGDSAIIDVSGTNFITVTGTIYTGDTSTLPGTLVTFTNSSTGVVQTAVANASGTYSINIKAGMYEVSASIAGYLPSDSDQMQTFTTTTSAFDFGGSDPDRSNLLAANRVIEGTINNSAGSAMTDGYVWATNASGTVVTAAIDSSDGSYSLPVTDGVWTVKAAGPNHAETTRTATVDVSGSNLTSQDFSLTADSTKIATSTSGIVSASTGGSVNDTSGTGIKITAGSGVLDSSGNVTLNLEKTYTAPDSETFEALANATFSISASGDSSIKDLNGSAEIAIDFTSLISQLPSGVTENDLKLMYYSSERDEYVPVEGGFTINSSTNIISGQINHFTDFVIAYVPVAAASPAAPATAAASSAGIPIASSNKAAETTEPIKVPVEIVTTHVEATKPSITEAIVLNPDSSVEVTKVAAASFRPGATLRFAYQYQNEGTKSLKIRVLRQLLNSKGKQVAKSTATRVLKPGQSFKASVKDVLSKKLPPGKYTERVRVYNASTNKLIDENSFVITIEKLKKKTFVLGSVVSSGVNVEFDSAYLAKVKTSIGLPANFKMKYYYTNTNGKAQTVRMVRELVNAKGKVIRTLSGKWVMSVGERDYVVVTQAVPSSLAVGKYLVRVRAYDWKTKALLGENGLEFKVEMK